MRAQCENCNWLTALGLNEYKWSGKVSCDARRPRNFLSVHMHWPQVWASICTPFSWMDGKGNEMSVFVLFGKMHSTSQTQAAGWARAIHVGVEHFGCENDWMTGRKKKQIWKFQNENFAKILLFVFIIVYAKTIAEQWHWVRTERGLAAAVACTSDRECKHKVAQTAVGSTSVAEWLHT